jgi:hypothetical protein
MSKQTTLFNFINRDKALGPSAGAGSSASSTNERVHTYFYLEWADRKPKGSAVFQSEKPKKMNFKSTFHWNTVQKGFEVTLCGYFDYLLDVDPSDTTPIYKLEREKKYKNAGFLKSLLQKSIRRGDPNLSVQSAYHLMHLDFDDFIRRLPIIMIEDTAAHTCFSTLIWFMVAATSGSSPTFKFDRSVYEYILGSVLVICNTPVYHQVLLIPTPKESTSADQEPALIQPLSKKLVRYNGLKEPYKSLCYALQLRRSYGGMSCDMEMLDKYAEEWARISGITPDSTKWLQKAPVRSIHLASLPALMLTEWDVAAIDFHCAPQLIDHVVAEFPDFEARGEYVKKLIWHYSSKINKRITGTAAVVPREYKLDDWNKIKKYVGRVQAYLLEAGW